MLLVDPHHGFVQVESDPRARFPHLHLRRMGPPSRMPQPNLGIVQSTMYLEVNKIVVYSVHIKLSRSTMRLTTIDRISLVFAVQSLDPGASNLPRI